MRQKVGKSILQILIAWDRVFRVIKILHLNGLFDLIYERTYFCSHPQNGNIIQIEINTEHNDN